YVINLALKARECGFEIILIYNKQPKSRDFLNKLNDFKIKYCIADALSILDFWKVFRKLTKKYQPILVHSHFQPLLPSFYGFVLGYKYRWNTNRLMLIDKNYKEIHSKKALKPHSRLYRYLINIFTNKFFCVSQAVYIQYKNIYPKQNKKLHVLYNGVPNIGYNKKEARKMVGFSNSTIYICSILFASKIKGADILIKAFKYFIDNYDKDNVRLCLVGLNKESALSRSISSMIEEYNLNDKIINFGIINNVPEILPAMDIYVQPSRSESLSNAIIEAGLYAIPAIGTNIGGIPEVILEGKTGFLFSYEDSLELSEKLLLLVKHKALRENMGEAAKKHVLQNFIMEEKINQ